MLTIALAAALVATPAVPQGRYSQLCRAMVAGDKAALKALLTPDFASTDTSGHVDGRAAYVSDLADPGPVTMKRCSYRVISRQTSADGERDRAVWALEGTYKEKNVAQPFTAVTETEERWTRQDGQWLLRSQLNLSMKQWLAGVAQPTETYVPAPTPAQRAAIVADLRAYAHPLRTAYPGGAGGDLAPILQAAGSARVIAMGEGTHGTSEFFALKDRVFRYSVEHGGVIVFAQETSWTDGENIEQYLQTGKGNLHDLLAATFAVWNNQETFDLLEWMRAYNVVHPHALHFFGIDMQAPGDAANLVIAFYKQYDPTNAPRVEAAEGCVTVPFMTLYDHPATTAKCVVPTHQIFDLIAGDAARLEKASGRTAYLNAFHAADVAWQGAVMWSQPTFLKQASSRDEAMAHNVEWMLSTPYPRARVFLWAHNGHVGVGVEPWTSMGTYLRSALRSNYFVIGQTFDHGDLSLQSNPPAYVQSAQGNASEVVLRQAGVSPFFLNFADVPPRSALGAWLAQPHGIREIGAVWKASDLENAGEWEVRLPRAYDAIAFVDAAHAAHSFDLAVHRTVTFPTASGWVSTVPWTFRSYLAENANGGAQVLANGKPALYLAATPDESHLSAWLETRIDATAYRGKSIRLRGMLATSGVTTGSSMSIGAYGKEAPTPLAPPARGPASALVGTNAWTPVDITFNVPNNAQTIDIQFVLKGSGTAWLSDLSLSNDVSAK